MRNSKEIPPSNKWTDAKDFRSSVAQWAKKVRVDPKRVAIQPMRKKWASSSNKGLLAFNSQLLDERRDFGEYVIVHELLHLKVPNHGKLFKSLLTIYMPDWKERSEKATYDSSASFRKRTHSPQTQTFKASHNNLIDDPNGQVSSVRRNWPKRALPTNQRHKRKNNPH
jgi:hypothetical protein